MNDDINILILSCGTRNKIVQYFMKEIGSKGKIYAADSSPLAPALYEADEYFIVPRLDEKGYLDHVLRVCQDNNISAVLTLIDPEISVLAENMSEFQRVGTKTLVSSFNVVQLCLDKFAFVKQLKRWGYSTIPSYLTLNEFKRDLHRGEIDYPVFVKPVKGSASINNHIIYSTEDLESLFKRHRNLMIQKYMPGREFGIDAYVDMISGEVTAIFVKEKLKMRAGETDKAISIVDSKIFEFITAFIKRMGLSGVVDIDLFELGNQYYISEVNPRFGGGYPHAFECGVNVPAMVINNLLGSTNQTVVGNYEHSVLMLKYSDLIIRKSID